MEDTVTVIALVIIGVMFGSFINAFAWRWRQTHKDDGARKKLSKKKQAELSIATGRSMCIHCEHQLKSYDLVPIGSWVSLGGKCRYCRTPIGKSYPAVELLTGVLFGISYTCWPYGWSTLGWLQFGIWLTILVGLIALTIYDIKWLLLPFKLLYPLIGLTLLLVLLRAVDASDWTVLLHGLLGATALGGLFYGLHVVSNGRWIGGGDVVAAPALGLLAGGLPETFLLLFIASVAGLLIGLPILLKTRDTKRQIPFGPMLFLATFVVFLHGAKIIDWYSDLILG